MPNLIDPNHEQKVKKLRKFGLFFLILGVSLIGIALIGTVVQVMSGGFPYLFFLMFLGMPCLFFGGVGAMFGNIGRISRYGAGESAPVARDTFNYMADGTQEGVETLASAMGRGVASGLGSGSVETRAAAGVRVRCHKCNESNDEDARFCDSCGAPLKKSEACDSCGELNDPDARFCDNCGKRLNR